MVRGGVADPAASAVKNFLCYPVSVDRLIRSRLARSDAQKPGFFNLYLQKLLQQLLVLNPVQRRVVS
jgi:hypothetical protein